MFRKHFGVFAATIILTAFSSGARAGAYEMDSDTGDGLSISVTATVIGDGEVFDSRSCAGNQPAPECVFTVADNNTEPAETHQ